MRSASRRASPGRPVPRGPTRCACASDGYPPAAGTNATHAVPPPILQALLIIVALLYENRLGDVDLAENRAVAALLAPFRRWGGA